MSRIGRSDPEKIRQLFAKAQSPKSSTGKLQLARSWAAIYTGAGFLATGVQSHSR